MLAAHLPPGVILDGELIIWNADRGATSFVDLQRRLRVGRAIAQEAAVRPATANRAAAPVASSHRRAGHRRKMAIVSSAAGPVCA